METNEIIIVAIISIVLGLFVTFIAARNAEEIEEDVPPSSPSSKFEPRKINDLSTSSSVKLDKEDVTPVVTETVVAPKKRHYKKNYKKKPTNAKNAQVDKKPVGRPRKSQ